MQVCHGEEMIQCTYDDYIPDKFVVSDTADAPIEKYRQPAVCFHTAASICTTMTRVTITLCIYQVPRSSFLSPRSDMTVTCQEQPVSPYIQH
jgi:hypothetical protein